MSPPLTQALAAAPQPCLQNHSAPSFLPGMLSSHCLQLAPCKQFGNNTSKPQIPTPAASSEQLTPPRAHRNKNNKILLLKMQGFVGQEGVGRRKRGCREWHQTEGNPYGEQGEGAPKVPGGVVRARGDARGWAGPRGPPQGQGRCGVRLPRSRGALHVLRSWELCGAGGWSGLERWGLVFLQGTPGSSGFVRTCRT